MPQKSKNQIKLKGMRKKQTNKEYTRRVRRDRWKEKIKLQRGEGTENETNDSSYYHYYYY